MPEEILGWSGTRNVTRPLSAYGNSTRKVRKVDRRHPATGGGTCPEVSEETTRKKAGRMPGRCERPLQPKQRTKSWGLACAAQQR